MTDTRIDGIIDILTRLAAGDLSARLPMSDDDDELSVVAGGVNMLAEELEASFLELSRARDQLDERVKQRTIELEEQLATVEIQRHMIRGLSVPVLKLWVLHRLVSSRAARRRKGQCVSARHQADTPPRRAAS